MTAYEKGAWTRDYDAATARADAAEAAYHRAEEERHHLLSALESVRALIERDVPKEILLDNIRRNLAAAAYARGWRDGWTLRRWYACPRCLAEREVTEHLHANTLACSPTCPNCHTAAVPVEVSEYVHPEFGSWGREAHVIA